MSDAKALDVLQQGQNRVRSMALIHQNLYQEDNLTGVGVQQYFSKLINGLFVSNNIHEDRIGLDLEVDNLNLDVDTIVPIGLVTNELITNSLKYAFPDDRRGTISVRLEDKDKKLCLQIKDDGVGMTKDQYDGLGTSFGYKLVKALVEQMRGEMEIDYGSGMVVLIKLELYKLV